MMSTSILPSITVDNYVFLQLDTTTSSDGIMSNGSNVWHYQGMPQRIYVDWNLLSSSSSVHKTFSTVRRWINTAQNLKVFWKHVLNRLVKNYTNINAINIMIFMYDINLVASLNRHIYETMEVTRKAHDLLIKPWLDVNYLLDYSKRHFSFICLDFHCAFM